MDIATFPDLARAVQARPVKPRVAIVAANDAHTVESAVLGQRDGLIEAVLIGDDAKIRGHLEALGQDQAGYAIVPAASTEACLAEAVALVQAGAATVLMKGQLETGDMMRAILARENNLRRSPVLSVAGLYECERYPKLIALTDQAINTYPGLDEKKAILENAVGLLHGLGLARPKVAVLAAVEKVNPKMRETVDAAALKEMNQAGQITGCVVDGPLSFDLATLKEAATVKGYASEVAGDADLLIAPDLVCGNVLAKALTGFAGALTAGTVLGAAVPVVLVPRSAEASDKYYSLALAALTAAPRAPQG
jgi:phosphotransacetylase